MKPITYTIALDPSTTALGYAIFVDNKHFLSGSISTGLTTKSDKKDPRYNAIGNKLIKTIVPAIDEIQKAVIKLFDAIAVNDFNGTNPNARLNVIVEYPYGHFSHGVNNVIKLAFVAGIYFGAVYEILRVSAHQIPIENQSYKLVQASNWQSLAFGTNLDRDRGKAESIKQALVLCDWKPGMEMIGDDQADAINMAFWADKLTDVGVRRKEKLESKQMLMSKLPNELATLQKREAKLNEQAQVRKDKRVLKATDPAKRDALLHKHATYFLSEKDFEKLTNIKNKITELELRRGAIRNEGKAVFRR